MIKYIQALNNISSTNDDRFIPITLKDIMSGPYIEAINGKLYMVGACPYAIIYIPISKVGDTEALSQIYKRYDGKTSHLLPFEAVNATPIKTIPRSDIQEVLEKIPKIKEVIKEPIECTECNGTGEVEWVYGSYTNDDDCPVCNGRGEKGTKKVETGQMIFDYSNVVKIGDYYFFPDSLEDLFMVSETLDCHPQLLFQDDRFRYKFTVFKIEHAFFVLAPAMYNEQRVITSF